MKNKKGFTLVELLAVIAILAILIIIALPNVMGMFNGAKKNIFITELKNIYKGVQREYVGDVTKSYESKIYSKTKSGCSSQLSMDVKDEIEYYIEVNEKGKIVKFYAHDSSYQFGHEGVMTIKDIKDVEDLSKTGEKIIISCDMVEHESQNVVAELLPGRELNEKMKQLAGTNTSSEGYKTIDSNITAIIHSTTEPSSSNKESKNIVSSSNSKKPVYMWYDSGTIYYWSEENKISLNTDSFGAFGFLTQLSNISGLKDFDTSHVRNFECAFYACARIESLETLKDWDTSKVKNMKTMFGGIENYPMNIRSLTPLSNWNVSNVNSLAGMFQLNIKLTSLSGLENWNTSNVTNMHGTFLAATEYMNLTDISAISNWDTSNVTTMQGMFQNNNKLESIEALSNWNVSNVENMSYMFNHLELLKSLHGLENWNTSEVINMLGMFHNCYSLTDASAIENFNVSKVENMSHMFNVPAASPESHLSQLNFSKWNMANVKNYDYFMHNLKHINSEFTVRNKNVESFKNMLTTSALTSNGGKITVNYTSQTESLVDQMIATKSEGSNIVKGRLVN